MRLYILSFYAIDLLHSRPFTEVNLQSSTGVCQHCRIQTLDRHTPSQVPCSKPLCTSLAIGGTISGL